jgi:DNA-binding HxlR family transcriptional regulator
MFNEMNCSVARALSEVGERWSLLIVREAIMGSRRFDEFHQRLGIARNILADRLTTLVTQGVLSKTPSAENLRILDYVLTEKGRDLFGVVAALMHWGDRWLDNDEGPPVVLLDRKNAQPLPRVTAVRKSGRPVALEEVMIAAGPGATERTRMRLAGLTGKDLGS